MVRFLVMLTAVVIAVLAQAGPSAAHIDQFWPVNADRAETAASHVISGPSDDGDCDAELGCCAALCSPGHLSVSLQTPIYLVFLQRAARLWVARHDCLRSIILGRDPPVPRIHLL